MRRLNSQRGSIVLIVAAALLLAGCGATPTVSPSATPPPKTAAATAPTPPAPAAATATTVFAPIVGVTSTPAPAPSATATPPRPLTPVVEVFAKGLDTPWAIDFAPDGRIFFTERHGVIRVIRDGVLQPEPWMTITGSQEIGEGGLLGLAIDPHFGQNHFIYVAHTYTAGGTWLNRLIRLREDAAGQAVLDKVLLAGVPGSSNHDGGRVKFGPDGKLYWTTGDAQNSAAAQDPALLNGKILRLNPDGSIPADNPFPGSPVYSYGHRNPQGLAWRPGSGLLYATEHGPSGFPSCCRDELNLIEPGKNYGWPTITGDETRQGMVSPILQSGNSDTWAPSGATFVTVGPWSGSLLFAGLRGQALYRVMLDDKDPRKVVSFEALYRNQYGRLRDVVQGPDGALYVLTSNLDGRGSAGPDGDLILRISFH